ncbi:kti12, chromatin associated [Lecanora helva]
MPTHRSEQLATFFKAKIEASSVPRISHLSVTLISDHTLGLSRDVYTEASKEKNARATLYSAVKRALGKDSIVIADGLNYIKGYRYQLYCESKAVETPSCVVHIGTPIGKCNEINSQFSDYNDGEGRYPKKILDDLIYRYEEPNGMTRWDSPLFTVPYDDDAPPCDDIWEAMIGSEGNVKTVKPNQATVMKPAAEPNYLYDLDQITQEILNTILDYQKHHPGEFGGEIPIDLAEDGSKRLIVELPASSVSLHKLQRIRRAFIALNRQHTLAKDRIRAAFIEYLNDGLD